ncbi:non-ribosomal peptide synthetase [Brevundimonas sp.]|uniref:non-ribosomal peptide synthetase n=1 Tax=Brevundimonas sp. TaxID=1871086 RepID=UPI00286A4345|nr:non-ribosomal peptide synthetase [Brevundimonas sp.]
MRTAVAEALARHADRSALVSEDGVVWTYRRLESEARAVAARLPRPGLVVIEGGNAPATIAAYLGVLLAGGLAHLGEAGRAEAIRPLFGPLTRIACEGETAVVEPDASDAAARPIHPDLVLLFGTSGTTGASKMVKITASNILSNTVSIIDYLGLTEADRAITSLRPGYTYGLSVINAQLLSGGALLLTERSVQDPAFWSFARAHGATLLSGVPHSYETLAEDRALDATPSLRLLTQAGGKLRPDLVRAYARRGTRAGWRFCVMYGQTEASPRMAYLPPEFAETAPAAIGVAIPGGVLSLEDETGRPIEAPEVEGELIYRGPNVMAGYALGREDLALATPLERLATGDLAMRRADGLYVVTGRRSRFIKPLGQRIGLDDVEAMLARRGLVAAAVARGEGLLVAHEGEAVLDGAALAGELGIPVGQVAMRRVEALPRLASGKVDYVAVQAFAPPETRLSLPGHLLRFAGDTVVEAWRLLAGGGDARAISEIFADVLRRPVGPDDSFFGLGGDSLSYVELSIALEDAAGSLPDGWTQMTVGELERWRQGAL